MNTQSAKTWGLLARHVTALSLIWFASNANAQVSVWVNNSSDDAVGRQLAFELREGIRRSAAMELADRMQDGRLYIRLVTLDPDDEGRRTVYSATLTMQTFHETPVEMYLTSLVGTCGRNRVAECSRGLMARVDEQATDLRRLLRDALDAERRRK